MVDVIGEERQGLVRNKRDRDSGRVNNKHYGEGVEKRPTEEDSKPRVEFTVTRCLRKGQVDYISRET